MFALNPNYLLLTDYWDDRYPDWQTDYPWEAPGSLCPTLRMAGSGSNCFWQLMLGRLPVQPAAESTS